MEYPYLKSKKSSKMRKEKIMQKRFIFTITIMLGVILFVGMGFCGDGTLEKIKKAGLLTFGAETGMPWIQMDEKSGKLMGFDAEFMIEIGKRLGVEVKMVETNWDALIPALKQKRFDVIMNGMYITEKRLEVIDFGGPVYCYGEAIAIKKGDTTINKFDDLKNRKVGVLKASAYVDWLKSIGDVEIVLYETNNLALMDLNNGRLDAAVLDGPMASWAIKKDPKQNSQLIPNYVPRELGRIGVGIRKEDKDLKEAIDKISKDMMQDGTYERILSNYGMPPVECK
jgi:polar amino acid transport system substrate-binding protein